ncbi:MAG: winged helix-turn-helix domain-containing protein [Methylobacteriaceae bacterium]|nr:winged helix-turn-helix domain-containing protein [Methylobacteriaceae bacterium]
MPSLSIRIDLGPGRRIGPGKIALLEKIAEAGSIAAGGRALDMSYKRAWDLVDEIGVLCGKPVVAPRTGGKRGGGATLTPFGMALIERYREIEQAALKAVQPQLKALQREIGKG